MSATVADAIRVLCPTAGYTIEGNDYNTINWLSASVPKPTFDEVQNQITMMDLQAPYDACRAKAKELLAETDWSFVGDVSATLTNQADFGVYRSVLRKLAITPEVNPVWPAKPNPVWSN